MSHGWVIDASIGIAWVHQGQATPEAADLLKQAAGGTPILVPALWFVEMANILLVLQRRGKITAAERKAALLTIENMNLAVDDESIRAALRAASGLAESHGLTVYDATYLEVAIRRGMGLATRDALLRKAAQSCGVMLM